MKSDKQLQAVKKAQNYFEVYVKTDNFQKATVALRRKLGIPLAGLPLAPAEQKAILTLDVLHFINKPAALGIQKMRLVRIGMAKITKDFPIDDTYISFGFTLYLIYNSIFESVFTQGFIGSNVCRLVDLRSDFLEREGVPDMLEAYIDSVSEQYPIALLIRPEASQRDVVGYIGLMYQTLEIYQERHALKKTKLGKIRTKKPLNKEVHAYIFENRELPRIEIMRLVNARFGVILDPGHIGKIISLELKRRREV